MLALPSRVSLAKFEIGYDRHGTQKVRAPCEYFLNQSENFGIDRNSHVKWLERRIFGFSWVCRFAYSDSSENVSFRHNGETEPRNLISFQHGEASIEVTRSVGEDIR